jgi:hypothetical protein
MPLLNFPAILPPAVAKVYIVSFRSHDDRRPSKFIVLADNMKSAINMASGSTEGRTFNPGSITPTPVMYRLFGKPAPICAIDAHLRQRCRGLSFAKVFTVDFNSLKMVIVLGLLVVAVWSLIALSLFSMGTEDVEIPSEIIWLSLGTIGFSAVLLLFSAYL